MTVSTTLNKIIYNANSITTAWTFPFPGVAASDIQVFITTAAGAITQLATNLYSVTLNPAVAPNPTGIGGAVNYPLTGSPLAAGNFLTILRTMPITQTESFPNQGTLYQPAIEGALDDIVLQVQQINELFGRSLVVAVSDPNPTALPSAALRANMILGFDGSGNPTAVSTLPAATVSSAMLPVVSASSISVAQSLLGIQAFGYMPVGAEFDYPGLIAPQYFFLELGNAISRVGFPELLAVVAPTFTCTINSGNTSVVLPARADGLQPTTGLAQGMPVEAAGILNPGTTISSLSNTTIVLSLPPILNGASLQIFPHGNGDGSTTYNLPEGRGYVYAGLDPQAGTARLNLGNSQGVSAAGMSNDGGEQSHTQTLGETPTGITTLNDPGHIHVFDFQVSTTPGGVNPINGVAAGASGTTPTHSNTTGITPVDHAGGGAHNNVQPTSIRNKIIYAGRVTI